MIRFLLLSLLMTVTVQAEICQTCGIDHGRPASVAMAADGYPVVCRTDERAYQWALREAQILAQRGSAGHPLGVAPGCSGSGTGYSWDTNRPNHCFYRSGRRLVARARVIRGGRAFWSAHYR